MTSNLIFFLIVLSAKIVENQESSKRHFDNSKIRPKITLNSKTKNLNKSKNNNII